MAFEYLTWQLEIKSLDEDGVIEGYAAAYDNVDHANDIVAKGAFKGIGSPQSIKMLWQHDQTCPIGVWEAFTETEKGLLGRGRLLIKDVQKAREAYALAKVGALDGLSVGFNVPSGGSSRDQKGRRVIKSANLMEVSLVTFPCNDAARISAVKALTDTDFRPEEIKSKRDLEVALRNAGFSRSNAAFITAGWTQPARRDAEGSHESKAVDQALIDRVVKTLTQP